jgi:hypothetical protein
MKLSGEKNVEFTGGLTKSHLRREQRNGALRVQLQAIRTFPKIGFVIFAVTTRKSFFPQRRQKCGVSRGVRVMKTKKGLYKVHSSPALNLAPFGRWTLRDKAAQRRLALR